MKDGSTITKAAGKKRRVAIVVGAVVVAVIGMVVFWQGQKEPEYQGKKLSEWVEICSRYDRFAKYGGPAVPEEQLRVAVKAIRQIGTNALPLLVHWLEIDRATGGHMYRAAEKLPAKLRHQRIVSDYLTRPHKHFAAAQIGFEILGSEAFYAIPDLARLVERGTGQTSGEAVKILFHLGGPM